MRHRWVLGISFSLLALFSVVWGGGRIFSRPIDLFDSGRDQAQMHIGNATLTVWMAVNQDQWTQGLSGTDQEMLGADGMLFVFPDQTPRHFWMKDMRYDLDVLWIADSKIVKITEGVVAPAWKWGTVARMDSEPFAVSWVLEVPKGTVARYNWQVGEEAGLTPSY